MKRPLLSVAVYTPLVSLLAAVELTQTPAVPINPIIEIWRTTGLTGLSLIVALSALWLVKYLIDKLLELTAKEAQNTATLNAQLNALIIELRKRTRIVPATDDNDNTPFKLHDSKHQ
jgi:hypothetical protein